MTQIITKVLFHAQWILGLALIYCFHFTEYSVGPWELTGLVGLVLFQLFTAEYTHKKYMKVKAARDMYKEILKRK